MGAGVTGGQFVHVLDTSFSRQATAGTPVFVPTPAHLEPSNTQIDDASLNLLRACEAAEQGQQLTAELSMQLQSKLKNKLFDGMVGLLRSQACIEGLVLIKLVRLGEQNSFAQALLKGLLPAYKTKLGHYDRSELNHAILTEVLADEPVGIDIDSRNSSARSDGTTSGGGPLLDN